MSLSLHVRLPVGPLRRADGAIVDVVLTNAGSAAVLVNRRMAPGYVDSTSREIYFDVSGAFGVQKYERDYALPTEYVDLSGGASLRTRFDLLSWYRVRSPGTYSCVAHYEADEPGAPVPPGIYRGVVSSEPFAIDVE